MWTIYDHPADYPDLFVARRWTVGADGLTATDDLRSADHLDALRESFADEGLVMIAASDVDDPCVVETWM